MVHYVDSGVASGAKERRNRRANRTIVPGSKGELARERERIEEAKKNGTVPITFKEVAEKFLQSQKPLL